MKRCWSLLAPLAWVGLVGCAAGPFGGSCGPFSQAPILAEPPHSRFHPVPTRPVFENRALPPPVEAPPTFPSEWPPAVVVPESVGEEPALLPELPPPSSRRIRNDSPYAPY